MLYPQEKSFVFEKLNLGPRILATALYMHYSISPSNGGLQVHSKVLTGIVPGYLLGQTSKVNIMKRTRMSLMRATTR